MSLVVAPSSGARVAGVSFGRAPLLLQSWERARYLTSSVLQLLEQTCRRQADGRSSFLEKYSVVALGTNQYQQSILLIIGNSTVTQGMQSLQNIPKLYFNVSAANTNLEKTSKQRRLAKRRPRQNVSQNHTPC